MNIAIDIRSIGKNRTGDEVYMTELVKGIASQPKSNFSYFLFTDTIDWKKITFLRELPDFMQVIIIKPASKFIWTMIALPRACHQYDIDLLHVMYITPLLGLPEKTRLLTTIHDISWKIVPEYINPKDKLALNLLIPLAIRRADHIVTVSKHAKHSIKRVFRIPENKITAIYNGGYIHDIPSVLTTSQKIQRILEHPYILYLGSLQPRKNIPTVIDAFYQFKKANPESQLKLVIAGGKGHNYDNHIDERITTYHLDQDILRPGFVTDHEKYALLHGAIAFIFMSFFEGFGIPPIEAMSFRTPVIAANSSCLPEVVGEGGMLVDPHDPKKLAQMITQIVKDKRVRHNIINQGLIQASQFTWDRMVENHLKLYKKVLLRG